MRLAACFLTPLRRRTASTKTERMQSVSSASKSFSQVTKWPGWYAGANSMRYVHACDCLARLPASHKQSAPITSIHRAKTKADLIQKCIKEWWKMKRPRRMPNPSAARGIVLRMRGHCPTLRTRYILSESNSAVFVLGVGLVTPITRRIYRPAMRLQSVKGQP